MSLNNHGLPSRVPVIAELGRMFADPAVPEATQREGLDLLLQDHADLDEVEAQAALWAMGQISQAALGRDAWLGCASAWLLQADLRPALLALYLQHFGPGQPPAQARWVLALMAAKAEQAQESDLLQSLQALLQAPA